MQRKWNSTAKNYLAIITEQTFPPSPTGRIQINGKKELKFTSLQSGDTGTVQCAATNDAGEAITTAVLNVKGN